MSGEGLLRRLRDAGQIGALDAEFAGLLSRLHPGTAAEVLAAAALVCRALREGHTCLPLPLIAEQLGRAGSLADARRLREAAAASGAVAICGMDGMDGDEPRPLVLDADAGGGTLSLWRWRRAEARIARDLVRRGEGFCEVDAARARPLLDLLFPAAPGQSAAPAAPADWDRQRAAAALALCKRLLILLGGPGTGKTYTLARMLALFTALRPDPAEAPRIALTAPTGRAAKRLGESIRAAAALLPSGFRLAALPEPQTLHRLLGFRPESGTFARNRERPLDLDLDLVVVDEASMADTRLLDGLLAALPAEARLTLCGDPGQLPPVEPGGLVHALDRRDDCAYSAELRERLQALGVETPPAATGATAARAALADCRVILRQARRFARESGIFALVRALESEEPAAALAPLLDRFAAPGADVEVLEPGPAAEARLTEFLRETAASLHGASSPGEALAALGRMRVLCALREGRFGETGLNARCRELLRRLAPETGRREICRGLPLLILENDYGARLFNGDAGIILPDAGGELKAWFEAEDGPRALVPAALPRRQPAYAMTVHKAQGGEFDQVLLVLPDAVGEAADDNPLLTRELLYTAVTRAKKRLVLLAPRSRLLAAAGRGLVRYGNAASLLAAASGQGHSA